MASSYSHSLKALVIFRNIIYPELMRGVHVYQLEGGGEEEVEREYVFRNEGDYYEEIGLCSRVLMLNEFCASAQFEGMVNGVWLCIFAFDSDRHSPPDLNCIPTILSIYGNPKLASIPTLANDLHTIYQLGSAVGNKEPFETSTNESSGGNDNNYRHLRGSKHISGLDLNRLPYSQSENQEFSHSGPERKKKRAASEDIARLGLKDLVKYFDLPIVEASKNLRVGLTVLKRKCREFGIPRWPHRKIKSLDGLIRDLQDEVERQREDKKAAMVVAKRQKMIEKEKENIERKPFMEIQRETKKFRQDIFKKRHIARALENQTRTLPLF